MTARFLCYVKKEVIVLRHENFDHIFAGEDMEMQVHNRLADLFAAVVDDTVTVKAVLFCDFRNDLKDVRYEMRIAFVNLVSAADMLLGDNENVLFTLGIDVVEGVAELVLINL